jgi:hypothetical protein
MPGAGPQGRQRRPAIHPQRPCRNRAQCPNYLQLRRANIAQIMYLTDLTKKLSNGMKLAGL